jgi:hypothetical protein
MKKLLLIITATFVFASQASIIKNLIGPKKYYAYRNFINQTILKKHLPLEESIKILKENGLIDIFFKKPKIFKTTFVFSDSNLELDSKILNDILRDMGYFYFYPVSANNKNNYKLTIEMQSTHYIDPLDFITELKNYNCKVKSVTRNPEFTWYLNCYNAKIPSTPLNSSTQALSNTAGEYWINPNGFRKISIKTSPLDSWHPYVVFYDRELNILNIVNSEKKEKKLTLKIPRLCKYIKIRDIYTKENIKRGIFIKGLK